MLNRMMEETEHRLQSLADELDDTLFPSATGKDDLKLDRLRQPVPAYGSLSSSEETTNDDSESVEERCPDEETRDRGDLRRRQVGTSVDTLGWRYRPS